jgi:hypothetical protein
MRGASRRLAVITLLLVLSTQSVLAAPDDRDRTWSGRVKHLIVAILDQLGVPPG